MATFDPYHDVFVKLPPQAQQQLTHILTSQDPMAPGVSKQLAQVLNTSSCKAVLDTIGLVPEYYAWALVYWAGHQNPQALRGLIKPQSPPSASGLFGRN